MALESLSTKKRWGRGRSGKGMKDETKASDGKPQLQRKPSQVIGGALLLVSALGALRFWVGGHLSVTDAVMLLKRLEGHAWAVPGYLLLYVALTTLFLPAALFHVAAGVTWGFKGGVLLNLLACNGGATLQFFAARRLGRERVRWLLNRKGVAGLDALLSRAGFETCLLIRLIPLPTVVVNVAAGLSSVRWPHFALGTLLGTLPIILVYTGFAAALAEGAAGTERKILIRLVLGGLCLGVLAVGQRLLMRWRGWRGKPPPS